jgi:hypothetical protein
MSISQMCVARRAGIFAPIRSTALYSRCARHGWRDSSARKSRLTTRLTPIPQNKACNDLSPAQSRWPCSDANGTAFWRSLIALEDPDLFLFTGDNVCGGDPDGGAAAINGLLSDWAPGGPNAGVPWVAVEGNHDGAPRLFRGPQG